MDAPVTRKPASPLPDLCLLPHRALSPLGLWSVCGSAGSPPAGLCGSAWPTTVGRSRNNRTTDSTLQSRPTRFRLATESSVALPGACFPQLLLPCGSGPARTWLRGLGPRCWLRPHIRFLSHLTSSLSLSPLFSPSAAAGLPSLALTKRSSATVAAASATAAAAVEAVAAAAAGSAAQASLYDLPDELLLDMFAKMSCKDVCSLTKVRPADAPAAPPLARPSPAFPPSPPELCPRSLRCCAQRRPQAPRPGLAHVCGFSCLGEVGLTRGSGTRVCNAWIASAVKAAGCAMPTGPSARMPCPCGSRRRPGPRAQHAPAHGDDGCVFFRMPQPCVPAGPPHSRF